MAHHTLLTVSDDVKRALATNQPVVALESTVIAHGLPRPQNLETALRLQEIIRDAGAVPATIAILNGKLCVGLDQEQLRFIANSGEVKKISTRDLPVAVARRLNGATTVASTAWIAHRAGINVFSTGGIGGVHKGALPDVSADLPELARTPLIVVCSGAKIVLDLPATREWLETHGITIVGYQCEEMPAFYSRTSGLPIDIRADGPDEVAAIFRAQRTLELQTCLLVTVPVPDEAEVPASLLERVLNEAMVAAEQMKIAGHELTPFLLSRMANESKGATLQANLALLENNARVAGKIAGALRGL